MILIAWFKEIKTKEISGTHEILPIFPNYMKQWLLDILACSDPNYPTKDSPLPYVELSRTYAKMRNEANQLLRAVESSGMFTKISVDVESLTSDDAITFASKLQLARSESDANDSLKHVVDDIESLKQRLLTTAGYLKCVQVFAIVMLYSSYPLLEHYIFLSQSYHEAVGKLDHLQDYALIETAYMILYAQIYFSCNWLLFWFLDNIV